MDAWPVLVDEWVDWVEEVGQEAAGIVANKPLNAATAIDLTGLLESCNRADFCSRTAELIAIELSAGGRCR